VWYKDSFEIFSTRRMRVTVDNDESSLVIHQTAFTDEGEYKCTATNRAGHIITKAKLRLEGMADWLAGVLLLDCAARQGATGLVCLTFWRPNYFLNFFNF
jgi:hypothetical protein